LYIYKGPYSATVKNKNTIFYGKKTAAVVVARSLLSKIQ